MFTPQQFKIIVDGIDTLKQEELGELLKCFPFENILNVSIVDFESMRLHISFLKKLSLLDMFYKFTEAVKCCWEFTLVNLLSLENVPLGDVLFSLLELLKHLISKLKSLHEFTSHVMKERERIMDILTFVVKLKIFVKFHVTIFNDILKDLIEMQGPLPLTFCKNLSDVAEVYKELQVIHELALLCDVSLNKFTLSNELSNVCIPWLLANGPRLLVETSEENTVLLLLKIMTELYTKCNYSRNTESHQKPQLLDGFEQFELDLKKVSHHTIFLSGQPILRDESLKLLSVLISQFHLEEMGINEEYTTVLSKLLQLPLDIRQWPQIKSDMFFYICNYLCMHSSLCWNSSEVLESISRLIYSYDRFALNITLLKILCYIYPLIMTDLLSMNTLLLGDELLIILSRFPHSFPKIISYNVAQLVWILKRGCGFVKKHVLVEWLNRDKDHDILGKAIVQCQATNILLDIVIDWRCDALASSKATEMCRRIQDKELSEKIAWMIPTALRNEPLLGRLILSNPGVPDNAEIALKICEFMSLILCLIEDVNVLKAACVYSKYLVTALKKEDNTVGLFCRNIKNIQFLAIKVKYVEEDIAIEILRLLKVLILVQKRNHNLLENQVAADLSPSLVGSTNKIEKCLDLLQIIVTSKDVLIKLEKSSILNIFMNLFRTSQSHNFAVRSFTCLTGILKTNEWLAQIHSTSLFIEIQCSLSVDQRSGLEFFMFLTVWMKILRKTSCVNIFYLPDKRIISNYIKRSGFISQQQVIYSLKLLNKIKIFSENSFAQDYFNYNTMHQRLF